jgi:nicotinate-nucleotide pyrophosphorylase (carboxylating)
MSVVNPQEFSAQVASDVARALAEDVRDGDLTASLIDPARMARATIICREDAVICGQPWAQETLRLLCPSAQAHWHLHDGQRCEPNQVVVTIDGPARELLTAERTMLNFMQALSAVATKTAHYVSVVQGTKAAIVDTRKTLPGLRMAQKYAVKCGGGVNHRIGLFDAVLIKENHIAAAGGITAAVAQAQRVAEQASFIEVEVETLKQLEEALGVGVKMVLLDNMPPQTIREAVRITAGRAILEVSGNVNLDTLRSYAECGVDRISIGGLTKDVKAVDFSMRFADKPVEA